LGDSSRGYICWVGEFSSEGKSPSEEDGSAAGGGVYSGENSSMAPPSTVHSGSTVDESFDRRPERNFTIVESKQGMH